MIEARKLVFGVAILSGSAGVVREHDQSNVARSSDEVQVMEELVRQHTCLVYRIAHAVLRSHHDAEDATQETFLRVLRYSHKLGAVDDPKTWLARIAWRVAVDRSRRRGRRQEVTLEEKPIEEAMSSEASAYEKTHSSQVGAELEKLIAALPDKLRAPLILSALEELSPGEVAAALGINEAAVRSRVFRARQILRKKLARKR
jgi:RNA polymerase sigma-70 factor (ECF subfamily)